MKEFKVLTHNPATGRTVVIGTIDAQNAIEAKREAFTRFHTQTGIGEQLVCASKTQYERGWREKVEATEAMIKAEAQEIKTEQEPKEPSTYEQLRTMADGMAKIMTDTVLVDTFGATAKADISKPMNNAIFEALRAEILRRMREVR